MLPSMMLKTSIPIEISTWLGLIMLHSSHGIGQWGKFDKLQKLHFRRQVRHQPCFNNKIFLLYLMASCFCSSNQNRLISVSYGSPFRRKCFKMPPAVSLMYMWITRILFSNSLLARATPSDVHKQQSDHLLAKAYL